MFLTLVARVLSNAPHTHLAEVEIVAWDRWSRWTPFRLVHCGGISWAWAGAEGTCLV